MNRLRLACWQGVMLHSGAATQTIGWVFDPVAGAVPQQAWQWLLDWDGYRFITQPVYSEHEPTVAMLASLNMPPAVKAALVGHWFAIWTIAQGASMAWVDPPGEAVKLAMDVLGPPEDAEHAARLQGHLASGYKKAFAAAGWSVPRIKVLGQNPGGPMFQLLE